MSVPEYFHGGLAGLEIGDELTTGPPHIEDGCPICVARAEGRSMTVGEYRAWLIGLLYSGHPEPHRVKSVLEQIADAPAHAPMDPPSEEQALYVTTVREYAQFYASLRRGDLYRVEPGSELVQSETDHFPSFVVESASVLEVLQRRVKLTRRERRKLDRMWRKADKRADRARRRA